MTGPPKHKMRSKSDSYSYVIDKAMDIEKSMGHQEVIKQSITQRATSFSMGHQEVIKQSITQRATSFERGNAMNWYSKFLAKCYFEFLCAIAILTLIPVVIILGFNCYSNRTESYVSGHKFLVYDFKGVAPLNNNLVLQPGRHICDSITDSAQCHETYLEYDISGFVFLFVGMILVFSVTSNIVHRRLCTEIEKLQGRLIRYEDLLNNEGQLYTKVISEILSGGLKKEILEKDSQVTNVKMACKKDSADAKLEMDHEKEYNQKRKQLDDIIQMNLSETLGLEPCD
ncbi:uncharacterized protein EAE98_006095 [Botrytis deweyae]|uniref:Brl1/Brr6 domain-containing protein n=1 Tax=Botrytis deweyae TaxID=2478750 RepID=A0ABQ7ILN5_9HELO|nr:uncharacterized protein EAE98_006095 [Botrytis deweyae]KAF7927713.1 hypothetical protein EAE98_006095 [Botrytis deweyae]